MSVRFHDLFCGAGGSTLGGRRAGGEPAVAINHSRVACNSYAANNQHVRVDCADVVTVDPRRYPRADILLASPSCTHHSYARGRPKDDPSLFDPKGDQEAERSRATMWDVPRFAEHHDYRAIIVENVEAAVKWGLRRGEKLRHGEYGPLFASWLGAMRALGYEDRLVHLNAMFCDGTPQSRDRLFVVFWKRRQRPPDLEIEVESWCASCSKLVSARQTWKRPEASTGCYGAQYYYACPACAGRCAPVITPAAAAIDFSLPAQRIGERDRPLKPATIERIRRGVRRLGQRPDVVPLSLLVAVGGNLHERPGYARAWPTGDAMPTLTTTADRALVTSITHDDRSQRARSALEPLATQTGWQEHALVLANRENAVPRPTAHPIQTIVTQGGMYVVEPPAGLTYVGRDSGVPRGADEPMQTPSTVNRPYLVEPLQIDLRGENRARPVAGEPLSTVTACGNHHGIAFVLANYTPGWIRDPDSRELGTVTSRDHHALLTYRGGRDDSGDIRHAGEPASTITTVEQHALLDSRDGDEIPIEECTFRMLQPHELKLAQGFTPDYVLHGNKRQQVCQIGNAVPSGPERELVSRVIESLA